MKKILILIAAACALAGCDDKDTQAPAATAPKVEHVRASAAWVVDAGNAALDVVEFTPKTLPDHRCVAIDFRGLYCAKVEK